ncbi:hypothetical protein Thivi_4455 [Thiocystis violascens DSM 198]|uniref:Uncharacterized protein n=2 Tax=Thiocystis violascens TaxID=73141 RepID=I3YGY6_THIV6|nr:hypothetical protein Thivi_4455 [Thiocystis violascens DSM 198]
MLLCLTAWPVGAGDPVLARILAIEAERVIVSVEDGRAGADPTRVVAVEVANRSPGIAVGALVRLWPGASGDPLTGGRLEPLADDLGSLDRTGVRARLMQGGQRGFGGGLGGGGRGSGTGGR